MLNVHLNRGFKVSSNTKQSQQVETKFLVKKQIGQFKGEVYLMFLKVAACSSFVSTWCLVASAEGFSSLGIYYALGLYTLFLTAPPGEKRVPVQTVEADLLSSQTLIFQVSSEPHALDYH